MSNSCRRATLKDWWPDRSTGVCRMPFSPSLFLFSEAIDSRNSSSECLSPVSTPDTSTCSHSMGTLSALKTVLTDSATSAPIPSPGIRVTVYLPPYLVGLKISFLQIPESAFPLNHTTSTALLWGRTYGLDGCKGSRRRRGGMQQGLIREAGSASCGVPLSNRRGTTYSRRPERAPRQHREGMRGSEGNSRRDDRIGKTNSFSGTDGRKQLG